MTKSEFVKIFLDSAAIVVGGDVSLQSTKLDELDYIEILTRIECDYKIVLDSGFFYPDNTSVESYINLLLENNPQINIESIPSLSNQDSKEYELEDSYDPYSDLTEYISMNDQLTILRNRLCKYILNNCSWAVVADACIINKQLCIHLEPSLDAIDALPEVFQNDYFSISQSYVPARWVLDQLSQGDMSYVKYLRASIC